MRWIYLVLLFCLVVFSSCESPTKDDVIGTWESKDSARFQFYNDGSFYVKNIPKSILFGNCKDISSFSGKGVWNIQYIENTWQIELLFSKNNSLPGGFACYLNMEKKINLGSSSWNLFFYDGNIDYKYIFIHSK